ncbi:LPXTG cell wall anchor domain-containing protein [Gaoshiqia sp. Z1-71]|uniref:LPXTG cell wall anchor domain-containing protein n=1 Tax=Gaoshiqia hydrogeniformans TaxID=3290090 RepID=UPI003BF870F7
MKKLMIILAMTVFLAFGNVDTAVAQQEDLFEMEDTLSIDDMDPVFYEAEQGAENSKSTVIIVIVVVAVAGGAAYYVIKKKKK